jgi:thiamine-phosphate pyrophosphorylase
MANRSHPEIVAALLAGGARWIQIRDKEATARELFDAVRSCLLLTRAVGATLIVNDRVDVALTTDADGIHLGQEDLTVEEAREVLGPEKIIGISTHSLTQFEAALETTADYLAIGPIFPTTSKENPDPVVGLDLLRQARQRTERPIVAIGGIDQGRFVDVFAAGADSIAVISALYPWPAILDLTSHPDITGSVQSLLEHVPPSKR